MKQKKFTPKNKSVFMSTKTHKRLLEFKFMKRLRSMEKAIEELLDTIK